MQTFGVRLSNLITCFFTLVASPSFAASAVDAFGLFDALCVSTGADLNVVEKMALAAKAKPMPPEMMNLDQAMAEHGGKSFILSRNGSKYSVAVTTKNACSVLVVGASAQEMRSLLQKNYPLGSPIQDSSGVQNITFWKIVAPSRYQGSTIMLNQPKPGFGVDDAFSIGFIASPK